MRCVNVTDAEVAGLRTYLKKGGFLIVDDFPTRQWPVFERILSRNGDELAAFPDTDYTDRYVKILFPRPGVVYPEPFDMDAVYRSVGKTRHLVVAHDEYGDESLPETGIHVCLAGRLGQVVDVDRHPEPGAARPGGVREHKDHNVHCDHNGDRRHRGP